jgi:hypothetical protein
MENRQRQTLEQDEQAVEIEVEVGVEEREKGAPTV